MNARLTLSGAAALVALLAAGCGSGSTKPKPGGPVLGAGSAKHLHPPQLEVRTSLPGQAPGFVLLAPKLVFGNTKSARQQEGPMIMDSRGRVRWFSAEPGASTVFNFRTGTYRGKPVLTYFEGKDALGIGSGVCVVRDEHYDVIARVHFQGPNDADFHECRLTDRGTMLMTGYETIPGDTSKYDGGTRDGKIIDGVVKEIDVATGKVKLTWRSLEGGVPLSASYATPSNVPGPGFDYIHVNSVSEDTDGNLLVSARHTWSIYKINRKTGKLMWTLGGKRSDFRMGKGAQTTWQHDAEAAGPNVIRAFDNASGPAGEARPYPYSRVTWVKVDPAAKTATLVRTIKHPDALQSGSEGNAEALPNGDTFVGWGFAAVVSEFSPAGKLLFDAGLPSHYDTYRAFRAPWVGKPDTKPEVVSAHATAGGTVVRASWNGSTEVQRWQVLAGATANDLKPVGTPFAWNGLITDGTVPASGGYVAVRALDGQGETLADSPASKITP